MSRQRKKTVSLLLAIAMVLSVFAGYPLTVSAATPITGGGVISESGTYEVAPDATGDITINAGLAVTLVGNGVGEGKTANSNLTINCGAGVDLTVENLWISNESAIYAINYTGTANKLNVRGTNLIETDFADSEKATIHVASGTDLTIDGEGTLYGYKRNLGSLIGGDGGNSSAENSGKITINGGNLFLKGSMVGAVIGTGGQRQDAVVGDVTINGGNVNIANKAMGAGIGGGKEEPGGTVYIKGGNVTITTDWKGSAIGRGGGGSKPPGTLTVTGGSLKTYITSNAAGPGGWGAENEGVNDSTITAAKANGEGEDVAKCVFDTTLLKKPASEFTVEMGGTTYYQGGFHGYDYAPNVSDTMGAWKVNDTDKNLYLYLSKASHEFNVNGEKFQATWDETNSTFKVERISPVDVSWYNTTDSQFTLTTGKQLAGLATIVNGTADGIERDSFQGKTITLGNDIDLSQVKKENQAPIGTKDKEFQGTFDGNGKTITGLNLSGSSGYLGLFGSAGAYSIIKNFTLEGNVADSSKKDFVGAVTGFNAGIISDVVNKATVNAPGVYNVGAMAGLSTSGKWIYQYGEETVADAKGIIERCTNYATITGYNKVGGMVGENAGIIRISVNHGKIDGTNASSKNGVGGITGRNGNNNTAYETGVIVDCYNTGEVGRGGQKWVGGIVGFQNAKSSVTNSYNVGTIVKGAGYNNPIVGQQEGVNTNCYALDSLYASSTLESEKGIPKTAEELKSEAFIAQLNGSGAAFMMDNAENPINNGYPILKWEQKTAAGVDALIEAIGEVTLDSEGVIVAARDAYTALSDTEKAKVTKLGVLEAAEARYAELKAAKELADAKKAAKTELENYKDPADYRDAEKAILANEVAAGKTAIDEAGTIDDVNGALAAAKAKIDAIKTDAQYVAEEKAAAEAVDTLIDAIGEVTLDSKEAIDSARNGYDALNDNEKAYVTKLEILEAAEAKYAELKAAKELADAKEAAKTELENYKDPSLYRDAEKAILAEEIAAGKSNIDGAESIVEVNAALAAAKIKIDAIKTDAQYVAEELAAAKEAAKTELQNYKDPADYRDAEKAILANEVAAGKTAIDEAGTIDDVNGALAAAKTKIDAIKTDAQYVAEELAAAKKAAKTELENYKNPADYRDAEKAILANEVAAGKTAIDEAGTIDEVNGALGAAKAKIDAIKTDAQYTAEEQQAASAVDALIDAIGEVTLESKDAIDSARSGYDALSDGAKAYVTKLATLEAAEAKYAELKAAKELADAKEAAKAELENYKDPALYRDAEKAILANEVAAGKTAIDEAGTIDDVNGALAAAKTKIDAIKTDAQYVAEELAAAKEAAKTELEGYKDPALYRDAEKAILADEIAAGKSNIDGAESMVEVNAALAAAKAKIDAIKTDAQYKAEAQAAAEAVDALIEAIGEVTTEKKEAIEKATNAYNALNDEAKALVENHDQLVEAQQAYKAMTQAPSFILEFPREANEEKLVKIKDGKLTFTAGESKGLVVRLVEGEMDRFINVTMDGKVVDPANYFVREGSIIVEFNGSYLETLSAGKHKVRINTNKGYGESEFFIARAEVPGQQDVTKPLVPGKVLPQKTKVTKTGDAQDMTGAYFMTLLALSVLLSLAAGKRRKEDNR